MNKMPEQVDLENGSVVIDPAGCDPEKPNLIWDLDNTLISAVPTEEYPFWDGDVQKKLAPLKKPYDMDGFYVIYERPGLQDFLDWTFKHFNVNIWTAATKDYCTFICKEILTQDRPNRKICWTFFSYHRKRSSKKFGKKNPKDLRLLWEVYQIPHMHSQNTFIVDDHPHVKSCQPAVAVRCPEFETLEGGESDNYLKSLKKGLEKYLKEFKKNGKKVADPASVIEPIANKLAIFRD